MQRSTGGLDLRGSSILIISALSLGEYDKSKDTSLRTDGIFSRSPRNYGCRSLTLSCISYNGFERRGSAIFMQSTTFRCTPRSYRCRPGLYIDFRPAKSKPPSFILRLHVDSFRDSCFIRNRPLHQPGGTVSNWQVTDVKPTPENLATNCIYSILLECFLDPRIGTHLPAVVLPKCLAPRTTAVN